MAQEKIKLFNMVLHLNALCRNLNYIMTRPYFYRGKVNKQIKIRRESK
jgi:hypothetical protein